jgi:excisionase family DNA binding protein
MTRKKVYTTGEVAEFCGVNFRTVIRWMERGKLGGYKLPGRGDHRVPEADLLKFLKANHLPVPAELESRPPRPVLLVEADSTKALALSERLAADLELDVIKAGCGFSAGMAVVHHKPCAVIIDMDLPTIDVSAVITQMDEVLESDAKAHLIGHTSSTGSETNEVEGLAACLPKPLDISLVISHIRDAIEN